MKFFDRGKSVLGIIPVVVFLLLWEIIARKIYFQATFIFHPFHCHDRILLSHC